MRLSHFTAGLAGLTAASLAGYLLFADSVTRHIPDGLLQARLSHQLPIAKNAPDVNLLVEDAQIFILDDGRAQIDADLRVSGRGISGAASARIIGTIEERGGALRLADAIPQDIEVALDAPSMGFIEAVTIASGPRWARIIRDPERRSLREARLWQTVQDNAKQRVIPGLTTLLGDAAEELSLFPIEADALKLDVSEYSLSAIAAKPGMITLEFDPKSFPLWGFATLLIAIAGAALAARPRP